MKHLARIFAFAVIIMAAFTPASACAAELVMFERAGCVWCERWNSEIGPVYNKTKEGKIAPLRRVHLDRMRPPEPALKSPVIYAPTFVVIENGQEIGRIIGYANDTSFWGLLGRIIAEMPKSRTDVKPLIQPIHLN